MADASSHKPKKGRSPSYPGINLETAIGRARTVYDAEGRHAAPVGVITKHWGYSAPTTGGAAVSYAALRKFGLLIDEGSGNDRQAKLTDLALEILLNPDATSRLDAIRRAAMKPPIHAELWDIYDGQLPSDDSLRYELVRNRGFTESGAAEFIREFRDTISFAQLVAGGTVDIYANVDHASHGETRAETLGSGDSPQPDQLDPRRIQSVTSVPIMLPSGAQLKIEGKFPIAETDFDYMLKTVLPALKPGWTAVQQPEDE